MSTQDGTPPVWVGLDVGTQSARAFAVCEDGRVAGSAAVALRGRRDRARHEQDPRAWWDAVAEASTRALAGIAPERVRGVATCATSGTVLLVDRAGEPLTPGLMYDDARAGAQAARLTEALGRRIAPEWGLAKILWMVEEWPALARGARLAHQADVITRRLVGRDVPSDASHALKSGYEQEREAWPDLRGRRAPPAAELLETLLPEVVRSGTVLGEVCAAAAARTAIRAGTPVFAGMTDGCAAQFAAGALAEGDWNSVLGTTLVLKGASTRVVEDPGGVLYSHRAPGGMWLPGGASSTGAGVLSARFPGRDLDELGARAAAYDRTDVLAYPLVSRGERFPFAAPDAQAFVLGEPAGEAELFAALLKGVAFVERLCFDLIDLLGLPADGELTLTGGATRSRRWCELRADALGRPVRLVEQPAAAVGMAILAASASAAASGSASASAQHPAGPSAFRAAGAMVRTREVIEPRRGRAAQLTEGYLRLAGELERRGWLDGVLARHARARAGP